MMSRRYIAFQLSSTFRFPKSHYFLEFAALFLFFIFISSSLQIIIQEMSYAAVASLLQTVDILFNYHQPSSISLRFKSQITSIHENTSFLQSFIEASSDRVNNWEQTIRQVTNKAEDIIELLLSDLLLESGAGTSKSEFEKGKYQLYDEIQKVREEMESIVNRVKGGRLESVEDGSEDEVMEIISRLCGGSVALETIAICGSGGIGKTTLALNAYHHPLIKEHFDVRAGTTVTGEHTWVRVIKSLLRSMKSVVSRSYSENILIEQLLQILGRRRYLIWVDDVWSLEVLERLKVMLPDYGNGSRILLTTRSSDWAQDASSHIHEMRLLDEDQTWNALRHKIFMGDPCPFQLEAIGKTIARSCGGHPLSIVVVSGILASDQTEAAWEDVSRSIKISSEEDGEILNLSYIYLPLHLRPCLLYLGLFKEGLVIFVTELVEMWVAEGFLNESEYKSLEETGEEYLEDLVRRSLVSVHERNSNRRIKSISVHDLVRGMCRRQAHIDNFNLHLGRDAIVPENIRSCRRVSGANHCGDFLRGVCGSTIRTLTFFPECSKVDLRCWVRNVRLLRILNLLNVDESHSLSEQVFQLFHLRYLAIYRNFNIPEAVSNLENLQTLIILHEKEGGMFENLPEGVWRMPQLRHLYIFCFKFPNEKGPTTVLQNLQTLSQAVDFICSIETLKMFPNLKRLDLLYTNKLRDVVEDYELHNLAYLHKPEVLSITMDLSSKKEHKMRCVTFPLTLKELSLSGLHLPWEDMKMVASLPNLEVLQLRNNACIGNTWKTSEGGFSRLVTLRIEKSDLKYWITKSSHFPRLWQLLLVLCSSLLGVPYEMVDIPTLRRIELDDTNQSLLHSAKWIQKYRLTIGHDPLNIDMV